MEEPAKPSPLPQPEAPTLQRPPGTATPAPESDEFAPTLHPGGPSAHGVARSAQAWRPSMAGRERYLLHGVVSEGGHGRILRAEDLHLERMVALKEPITSGGSTEERFVREARITARLQHPSIIPVYEAGRWPGGEPFYAMKLVSGRSLASLIEAMSTLGERLAALPHVLAVAEAMAYAHSQRIIHRDLKPANVLVGEFGETVVIDWGLAKELDRPEAPQPAAEASGASAASEPERTQAGTVMGTPAYMPPEQASGLSVDERADVYAVGAILYHLLSDRPPYTGTASQEVLQQVLQREPVPLAQLQPTVPQDLLDIVSRAMAREPARRYPSARELAEDLRRFQTGQLVGAHRYTVWELLGRFMRRHRVALAVGTVALVALALKGAKDHHRIIQERDRAEREWARAEQRQAAAEQAQREATERADRLTLLEAAHVAQQSPALVFEHLRSLSPGFTRWGQARTLAAAALANGVATTLRGHESAINWVQFSPDGQVLLSSSDDHTVRWWDLRTGASEVIETLEDEAWRGTFSPEGRYVASASKDGMVRLWEKATRTSRTLVGHTQPVLHLLFTPEGRFLITSGHDGKLFRWDVASGERHLLGEHEGGVGELRLLPGGRYLLVMGAKDHSARLWDLERGTSELLVQHASPLTAVAVASREGSFALSTQEGRVLLWTARGAPMRTLEPGIGPLAMLALSPDGRSLAAQAILGTVWLWDSRSHTSRTFKSEPNWKFALVFSPDGRWLAAGGKGGKARLWEVSTGHVRELLGGLDTQSSVAFSPDGERLATGSHDGLIRLHEVEERYPLTVARHGNAPQPAADLLASRHLKQVSLKDELSPAVSAMVFTPDGHHVLTAGLRDGRVRRSSLEGGPAVEVQAHPEGVTAVYALPSGERLATGSPVGTVALWNAEGQLLQRLKGPTGRILGLALSADGAQVAAGDESGEVWRWETASGQGRALGRHESAAQVLAFSPDGRLLVSGGYEGELRLWEPRQGTHRALHRHKMEVLVAAFSPDGRHVVSGSADHTLWLHALGPDTGQRVEMGGIGVIALRFSQDGRELFASSLGDNSVRRLEVATGKPLQSLRGHTMPVLALALAPEGQRLATASDDGTVRLWDLESGETRVLQGHEGPASQVAFSPDGRYVLSAGHDGTVRLWPDTLPLEPEALRAWVMEQSGP